MSATSSMPTALVIVESYYGNTRTIAQAVADGLADAGIEVRLLDADRAPASLPDDLDLLPLGAPTHNRGLPTAATRAKAHDKQPGGPSRGLREWSETATIPPSVRVLAFDTVVGKNWLNGSAAKAIAKALGGRGRTEIRSFVVRTGDGPLADGEREAARAWGRGLRA